ncbi:hypothetical protein [Synechococcus sp. CC9616]|uniref:hypothetical protein n=1 Tax=Synechococcus sp. CC9616 TaxID=110663 RepID=UPI00056CFDE3|nr:hypothetical protein [Synechococcus sp. CC9616]RPF80871.1 MAG: hypothetical protein CBB80_010330 [Synechococcus sp. TMED20]
MTDPDKPRALSYTEMMNGGRQRLDQEAHHRELDLRDRVEELERKVEHLEKALQYQKRKARRFQPIDSSDE